MNKIIHIDGNNSEISFSASGIYCWIFNCFRIFLNQGALNWRSFESIITIMQILHHYVSNLYLLPFYDPFPKAFESLKLTFYFNFISFNSIIILSITEATVCKQMAFQLIAMMNFLLLLQTLSKCIKIDSKEQAENLQCCCESLKNQIVCSFVLFFICRDLITVYESLCWCLSIFVVTFSTNKAPVFIAKRREKEEENRFLWCVFHILSFVLQHCCPWSVRWYGGNHKENFIMQFVCSL
jgi:hypothetical protein